MAMTVQRTTPPVLEAYIVGAACWFADQEKGFVAGQVTKVTLEPDQDRVVLEFKDDKDRVSTVTATFDQLASATATSPSALLPPLRNPPLLEATEDLTNLSYLNEPAVLHTILHRYSLRQIYTYSGIVLVAMNPFSSLPVYSSSIVQAYAGRRKGELEPHLFAIAEEAYRCMISGEGGSSGGRNQTIVVSGESGAGKTVSAKYIMRYFATVDDPSRPGRKKSIATGASGMSETEEQILATNPIMEAFGNAKTTRNDNSSRFGKYIEILFDDTLTIVGARIRTYLLERSRLVYQPETERNYHIFYQLLAGAPSSERKSLGLDSATHFNYLNQGGVDSVIIPGVDDAEEFRNTQKALSVVGITIERQWQIFKLLAALLHIGNIDITASRTDALLSDDDPALLLASELLGIDSKQFKKWLIKKAINTKTDKIISSLSAAQAGIVRDSVAKFIYSSLFDWLVGIINESLTNEVVEKSVKSFIGVLDIYGFEHFKKNSFEQFCINYANEKLQQEFNAHVFKLEQEEYVREQINWTFIDYSDNQPTIDLIESKLGILSLLDEESRLPSGSDSNFVQKLYTTVGSKPENEKVFKKARFGNGGFTIVHYALEVTYEADGFLEKNRDSVPEELIDLLQGTSNAMLKQVLDRGSVLAEVETAKVDKRASMLPGGSKRAIGGAVRKPTLGSIFKSSLINLMDTIDSTNAHYIRCIKPNEAKAAWEFDPTLVLGQLRACGVLETIRISCAGYPTRWTFEEFAERYYMLVKHDENADVRQLCSQILALSSKDQDPQQIKYQLGLTKIFFRAGLLGAFEQYRNTRLNYLATLVQKNFRRYREVKRYTALKKFAVGLQTVWRAKVARRELEERKRQGAALLIQRSVRGYLERLRFQRIQGLVLGLQSATRGAIARRQYTETRTESAAVHLQRLFRGLLAREIYARDCKRVILIQSCIRRHGARRELHALRQEAKSVVHFKEVSYQLENKVVELTQTLQKRNLENKELHSKLKSLDGQLNGWITKYEGMNTRVKTLDLEAQKPTVSLPEFEALAASKQELDAQLKVSLKKIQDQDSIIHKLNQASEKQFQELEMRQAAFTALVESGNDDSATVVTLRTEISSLREQLTKQVANNGVTAKGPVRPEGGAFNMATGRSVESGIAAIANGTMPAPPKQRRTRQHSIDDADSITPATDEEMYDTPVDVTHRPAAPPGAGLGFLPEVYNDPAEEIMKLLEDEEPLDADVLMGIIRHLKIPEPNSDKPPSPKEVLFPAHLISLVTNEMWKYGMMRESERFLANVMQTVQQHVMSFSADGVVVPGIFWLSNVHEILSFVCIAEGDVLQGIGPGGEGIGREYEWDDYERLVTIVKHDLDSLEYNIYHTWMQETKKCLYRMIIPALIESQSLPGFLTQEGRFLNRLVGGGNTTPKFSMDDILNLLNKVWKSLKSYYVEHTVVQQAITELLKLIGVTSFNDLLMRRSFSSWKRAMQIQYNITRLEEWCKSHDMPEGTLQLEHLMQATKLLQLKKASLPDIEIIYDVCWMLTPSQIQKLIANYYVADYEPAIGSDILKTVNARVKANDKNDHLLLNPEIDEAGPYEVPLPREVTGIETYVPAWLPTPHLRALVQFVSVA